LPASDVRGSSRESAVSADLSFNQHLGKRLGSQS
jgi:hypothetical protein